MITYMSDSISFISNEDIEQRVKIVQGQTDYSVEQIREKLTEFNYDHIALIRSYFGIAEKKAPAPITSVNQEIYKQLRYKLDGAMQDYNKRKAQNDTTAKLN